MRKAAMKRPWELLVLDAAPPSARQFGDLVAGDVDGDGRDEIIVGGEGALLWYRPSTLERGIIGTGHFHVGSALEDLDGDGIKEVVIGERNLDAPAETWMITWYKPEMDLSRPWCRHILDEHTAGGAHDLVFADLDGDGTRELVANAVYTPTPGLYAYKPAADITTLWRAHIPTAQSLRDAAGRKGPLQEVSHRPVQSRQGRAAHPSEGLQEGE
jgi:hypothetical protein